MEEKLNMAIGKVINEIELISDEDGMDQLFFKFSDNAELYLKNKKRKSSDDYRIYTEEDYSKFVDAKILNIQLEENIFSEDAMNPEIGYIQIQTDKGELNIHMENEGFETNLNLTSLFTAVWILN